jgi:hypothetical protein
MHGNDIVRMITLHTPMNEAFIVDSLDPAAEHFELSVDVHPPEQTPTLNPSSQHLSIQIISRIETPQKCRTGTTPVRT